MKILIQTKKTAQQIYLYKKKIEQKDNNPIFKTKKNSIYETFNNNTNNNNMKQELSPEIYAKIEEEDKKLKIQEDKVKKQMKNMKKEPYLRTMVRYSQLTVLLEPGKPL